MLTHLQLDAINASIITIKNITTPPPAYHEIVHIKLQDTNQNSSQTRLGRVIKTHKDMATIQVFHGTAGMSLHNTASTFAGRVLDMPLSADILGRTFNGINQPLDGLGAVHATLRRPIDTMGLGPTQRVCPRDFICTGFSAIDGLTTLVRGQKLPIFSVAGLPHNQLAVDIATSATAGGPGQAEDKFAVVFAAMGIGADTANFFSDIFEKSGKMHRTVMFLNLATDPPGERIATPRFALTAAEYLAFDCGYHVLVILTDMTAYAEALREISSQNNEIPSRKGYPGYLYSDLASIYERAGIQKNRPGSLTQLPILTMPAGDITHPIPDLTGYITEGQIVLDAKLHRQGIYPPINVLPSLSRLMKDDRGIAQPLFKNYALVEETRALKAIIGAEDLTTAQQDILQFGDRFEQEFLHQNTGDRRTMDETEDIAKKITQKPSQKA